MALAANSSGESSAAATLTFPSSGFESGGSAGRTLTCSSTMSSVDDPSMAGRVASTLAIVMLWGLYEDKERFLGFWSACFLR